MATAALIAMSVAMLCSVAAIVVLALQIRRVGASQSWQRIAIIACVGFFIVGAGNLVLLMLYLR